MEKKEIRKYDVEAEKNMIGISPTQVLLYGKCPLMYFFRYVEGKRIPPGIALKKGSSYHKAAEHNFVQKIKSGLDLPEKDIVEVAVSEFEKGVQEEELMFTEEEKSIGTDKVIGKTKDAMVPLAQLYSKEIAPSYQPVIVEETVTLDLNEKYFLFGKIDLGTDKEEIIDLKTGGRAKPANAADIDEQLDMYTLAYFYKLSKLPLAVALDTAIQSETKTKGLVTRRQCLMSKRDEDDIKVTKNRTVLTLNALDAGIFAPCARGSWNCNPKWCGYFMPCMFKDKNGNIKEHKGCPAVRHRIVVPVGTKGE